MAVSTEVMRLKESTILIQGRLLILVLNQITAW